MGRKKEPLQPIPVELVRECFSTRQDGSLIRRQSRIEALNGEPATFIGPGGRQMVRISVQGKVRRVLATKIAWCLAKREWPIGLVKPKNGDASDLRESNLIAVKHGAHHPNAAGGKASSLAHRRDADRALIAALSDSPDTSLRQLSRLTGSSEARTSARLVRLAQRGLTESPQCCPGKSWMLSSAGRELVAASAPVIDDLDRQVLTALALAPKRQLQLARAVGASSLTAKRRLGGLVQRGMVDADDMRRYAVTSKGRELLGDSAPQPWIDTTRISAAASRDVRTRLQHPNSDRSAAERSRQGSEARQKALATTNRQQPFIDPFIEFDRMAG